MKRSSGSSLTHKSMMVSKFIEFAHRLGSGVRGQFNRWPVINQWWQHESNTPELPHRENRLNIPVLGRIKVSNFLSMLFTASAALLNGIHHWWERTKEEERTEKEDSNRRKDCTTQMIKDWVGMADSRKAVRRLQDGVLVIEGQSCDAWWKIFFPAPESGTTTANVSTADQTEQATESVAVLIDFLLLWKHHHNEGDVNSDRLKEHLGLEFSYFHKILTKIHRDEGLMGQDEVDRNNLNEVVAFLDELSK